MLPGSEIFAVGTGWSRDFQSLLFLFSQMQKEDSIDSLLSSLMVDLTKLLCNPRAWKQHNTDLAQKPLAPTSTAKRCTLQPLDSMVIFSGRYLLNFSSCHFSMFSSHGQVNSIRITFLVELENMTISGRSWVKAIWGGKEYWSCRSVNSFQSNAWCKMPIWGDFLRGALAPFLTNLIKSFGFDGTDSILLMNLFRIAKMWDSTLSCLKVKRPCLRATLHAPKMCAVVQMVLLHRKQEILQRLRLLGDGKVSKVEDRHNEIRLTGDASKDFHEKSCWM